MVTKIPSFDLPTRGKRREIGRMNQLSRKLEHLLLHEWLKKLSKAKALPKCALSHYLTVPEDWRSVWLVQLVRISRTIWNTNGCISSANERESPSSSRGQYTMWNWRRDTVCSSPRVMTERPLASSSSNSSALIRSVPRMRHYWLLPYVKWRSRLTLAVCAWHNSSRTKTEKNRGLSECTRTNFITCVELIYSDWLCGTITWDRLVYGATLGYIIYCDAVLL